MNGSPRSPLAVALSSLGLLVTASLGHEARANVEIGGTAGVHLFNHDSELGVQDLPSAPSQRNSLLFGLRLGVFFTDVLGIEAELGVVPTVARQFDYSVTDLTYRAHLVAQFRAGDPTHKLVPFVFAGGGAFTVVSTSNAAVKSDPEKNIGKDTDAAFYFGVGAKYRIGRNWGVRADARLLIVPSSVNETPPNKDVNKVATDFEALASFYVELGRHHGPSAPPPPPPVDDDPDHDGITGAADQCPADPEDKDGYQDDDGCPEPDNDADGILDPNDRCPLEAEDRDGFQDEDGCPDPDNDTDGIPDGADRCPLEPEDKDGYQDDDGCPDPDNDGDGVIDGLDKCPDQPETKNGFADDDGCPDELPAKLKKFTGAIKGVNFKVNSAELLATSNKTLDAAVAVLVEFGDLKLEIGGHTDDQPIKKGGKFADNVALSQARAEAVRSYFVAHGIDAGRVTAKGYGDSQPITDPAGQQGGKLAAARAKNRRVEFQLQSPLK